MAQSKGQAVHHDCQPVIPLSRALESLASGALVGGGGGGGGGGGRPPPRPGWCYGKQGVGVVEGFQAKVMQNIPAWG